MDKLNLDHHISNQFNQDLEEARKHLMQMGGLVEQQVQDAVQALITADSALADKVIDVDTNVNKMEVNIDEECALILARRQPAASDLRFVLAVIKTVNDLERIGDEASKVAQHALQLMKDGEQGKGYTEVRHIGEKVKQMVQDALDSFARLDADSALEVLKADKKVDMEYGSAVRELITNMMEDPRTISRAMNVMWALRSLERIGDHARNISEYVIYLIKGDDVRHQHLDKIEDSLTK